jgi:hypothetical protein
MLYPERKHVPDATAGDPCHDPAGDYLRYVLRMIMKQYLMT